MTTTLAEIDTTLRRTPGRSDYEIAQLLGCNHKRVTARRTALIDAGAIPDRRLAHYGGWLPPRKDASHA
jgi:hypothetical protein